MCWTLDAPIQWPTGRCTAPALQRGTSLSKSFGLIDRFSEDIDITVFRNDLGEAASIEELEALSGKKRRARLDAIKAACQAFIAGQLLADLAGLATDAMTAAQIGTDRYRVELDAVDGDQQTLLFSYPSATTREGGYIQSAVKIEGGAKSALDPHTATTVKPYIADDLPHADLAVEGITTVEAKRTFWDKLVILHGLRRWYDHRGQLRHGGQRVSRHYYDVFRLLESPTGKTAQADRQLAEDCARHARMFFNTSDFDLDDAAAGTFSLAPSAPMLDALERDYNAMAVMIMGPVPPLAEVIEAITALEDRLNAGA